MSSVDRSRLDERIRAFTDGYRVIDPEQYEARGIDPADILVGTVAAENHPLYLLSRYGGNAFGLGLFEHLGRLSQEEAELLGGLDLSDPACLASQAHRINDVYKRLGLFVRYSKRGRPYYLIPMVWLAHAKAEIQDRADIIEAQVQRYQQDRLKERLTILLLAPADDLLANEISWRLAEFKVVQAAHLAELKDLKPGFDLAILPLDPVAFVLDQASRPAGRPRPGRADLIRLGRYLTAKLYDLLDDGGRLIVFAPRTYFPPGRGLDVRFHDKRKLANFLLFSHVYSTRRPYRRPARNGRVEVDLADLFNFLTLEVIPGRILRRLTHGRNPAELSLARIDALGRLSLKPKRHPYPDQRRLWTILFGPFFQGRVFDPQGLKRTTALLTEGLELSGPAPETEMLFVGDKRPPLVRLKEVEAEATRLGLKGCPLPLLAEYKDSFDYLLGALQVLSEIKADRYPLPPLILARLRMPFDRRTRRSFFQDVPALLAAASRLRRLKEEFNPDGLEGPRTPVLANLEKLSLLGFGVNLLREIFLILVGHSTLSRVTLGKMRVSSLGQLTRALASQDQAYVLDTVLSARLMSLAEMASQREGGLPPAQLDELFSLTESTIQVASNPLLDWSELVEEQLAAVGRPFDLAVRRLLKLFGLFERLDDWLELMNLGTHEREAQADYSASSLARLELLRELVGQVQVFLGRFEAPSREQVGFIRRFLEREFHGTTRLLPALGPRAGFTLLWLAVGLAPTYKINFNNLVPDQPVETWAKRLERLREALEALEPEALSPEFLARLAARIGPGRPVFVYHSGLTLRLNPHLGSLDAAFVDLEADLERLREMAAGLADRSIGQLGRAELQELALVYGRLDDYYGFIETDQAAGSVQDPHLLVRRKKIRLVLDRLVEAFSLRLFQPEAIYDNLIRLHDEAPRLLALLLPELAEMDRLPPATPHYPGQSMLFFFLEAAYKFQALASGRLEAFQDQRLLHRLAVQEFGPRAAGGVGATTSQMETLEALAERLQAKRYLLRAVAVALVFQDVARLPSYRRRFQDEVDFSAHGRAGGQLLKLGGVLDRYHLAPLTKETAAWLVDRHGLLARIVRGEDPVEALVEATGPSDPDLFDAFFLHNLAALAAVRPEALTEDLTDRLLGLRRQALEVLAGRTTWLELARRSRREAHRRLWDLAGRERLSREDDPILDLVLGRRGEAPPDDWVAAGLERVYRLRGAWYLTYEAVVLFKAKRPVEFIARRLGLASVGPASLERALYEALRLEREGLARSDPQTTRYLLSRLADLNRPLSIQGFQFVSDHLNPVNRLKLNILGMRAADLLVPEGPGLVTVSFHGMAETMAERYELVNEAASELDLRVLLNQPQAVTALVGKAEGLRLNLIPAERTVAVHFQEVSPVDDFRAQAGTITHLEELAQTFHDRLRALRLSPHQTHSRELALERVYEERRRGIIEELVASLIARVSAAPDLESLAEEEHQLQDDPAIYGLLPTQRELLEHAFEVRREALRAGFAARWSERLENVRDVEELERLWREAKSYLQARRRLIGREVERRLARWFDLKATAISTGLAGPAEE